MMPVDLGGPSRGRAEGIGSSRTVHRRLIRVPDIVARQRSNGVMYLYPGNGTGSLQARVDHAPGRRDLVWLERPGLKYPGQGVGIPQPMATNRSVFADSIMASHTSTTLAPCSKVTMSAALPSTASRKFSCSVRRGSGLGIS